MRHLFLDIDGVVTDDSEHVSSSLTTELKKISLYGIGISYITARPYACCRNLLALLEPRAPHVFLQGAQVLSASGELNFCHLAIKTVAALAQHSPMASRYVCSVNDYTIVDSTTAAKLATRGIMLPVEDLKTVLKSQICSLMLKDISLSDASAVQALISPTDTFQIKPKDSGLVDIEILPGHVSKANALTAICRKLAIPPTDTGYIGDDLQDVDCLKIAGWAGCPRNGSMEARAASQFVAKSSYSRGTAEIISHWIALQRRS